MPAKADIQNYLKILDFRLPGMTPKDDLSLFTEPSILNYNILK